MIQKLSKKEFVYTILRCKKTKSKLIRISPEVFDLIIGFSNGKNPTAFIHRAIAEQLFRDGLRLIDHDGQRQFRIEAAKPYVSKRCKNCWYEKNW
jgi:hypothetical protein